jgi:hypothetical protein
MGLPEKSDGEAGSGSNKLSLTTEKKAWCSSYLFSMGLPEKSDGAAGSGSNELNMTTKKAWSSSYLLCGFLRKAPARQVVAQMS